MNPEQEIAALEQIIDEILRGLQEIIQSGEILSDEFQGQIAQELEATVSRIDELRAQIQQPAQGPADTIPPGASPPTPNANVEGMPSSTINSFGYDPKTQRLMVKFNGKNDRDAGPVYGYTGIPENIFNIFRSGSVAARTNGRNKWGRWWKGKVPSLGAAMYTLIKQGNYPYQRLQ